MLTLFQTRLIRVGSDRINAIPILIWGIEGFEKAINRETLRPTTYLKL